MNTITKETVLLKLHKVQSHKTPFILTIYYENSYSTEFDGEEIYNMILPIIKSNNLSFEDVTIYYYFNDYNRIEDIYEYVLDVYNDIFVGSRLEKRFISTMSDALHTVHRNTIREIEEFDRY